MTEEVIAAPPPASRAVFLLCPDEECAYEQSFPLLEAKDAEGNACRACGKDIALDWSQVTPAGGIERCMVCNCRDLYKQRDFNRPLGLLVVVIAIVLARPPFYVSLWVAAAIDAVIYWIRPEVVVCYRCRSVYRSFPAGDCIEVFELERAAKYTKYVGG